MKTITMNKGYTACVDDDDYALVSRYRWSAFFSEKDRTVYARTNLVLGDGRRVSRMMHRVILGLVEKAFPLIDHRDHNGLNNQRENLRLSTKAMNARNRRKVMRASSPYIGVSRSKHHSGRWGKWAAYEWTGREQRWIGRFEYEASAAVARNVAIYRQHPEFGTLNKVDWTRPRHFQDADVSSPSMR